MQKEPISNDFRLILKEELASRCRQNPRYSLRAFARDIKLAPSRLSEILSGKQGLSREAADKLAGMLGYSPGERERFCDLVEAQHARSRIARASAVARLKKYKHNPSHQLQHDAFQMIADWYHFGILELTKVRGFKSESKWIASHLGVSEMEISLALERLERLGLISRTNGQIKAAFDQGELPGDIPSEYGKKFVTQILAKAKDALYFQPLDKREYGTEIIAINRKMIPEAKEAIRKFKHKFCTTMEDSEVKDGLYCLAIQFFDLGEGG